MCTGRPREVERPRRPRSLAGPGKSPARLRPLRARHTQPRMSRAVVAVTLALWFAACSDDADERDGAPGPHTADVGDAKADDTELKIRAGNLTVWIERAAGVAFSAGEPTVSLRGRTSRNLAAVSSWVPDDAFGEVEQTGARTFTLRLRGGHEVNSALTGLPLFLAFDTVHGAIKHHEARLVVAPRLPGAEDPDGVSLDPYLRPVYAHAADPLRYRLGALYEVGPVSATPGAPVISDDTDDIAAIDWTYPGLVEVIAAGGLTVTAGPVSASAAVAIHAVELGLTIDDPREVWPTPGCDPLIAECLAATEDPGDCGDYRPVAACVDAGR